MDNGEIMYCGKYQINNTEVPNKELNRATSFSDEKIHEIGSES